MTYTLRLTSLALLAGAAAAPMSVAQNTGGVFGPVVDGNERSVQYRLAYVPEEDGRDHRYAHRLHGELAIDNRRKARLIVQGADRGGPDGLEFDYVQAELFWELSDEQATAWNSGLRFDARISGDDRPDQFGLNWTNQFRITDRMFARAIALTAVQTGDNSADGVLLSARGSLNYKLEDGYSVALESYNSLGSSEDFGFDDNSQQLGPTVSGKFDGGWDWTAGTLFGVSDQAPDTDFRVWLGRSF